MKSLLVDNGVLLLYNGLLAENNKLHSSFIFERSLKTMHDEISVGKLFDLIHVHQCPKVAFCFKLQNRFLQRSGLIYSEVLK